MARAIESPKRVLGQTTKSTHGVIMAAAAAAVCVNPASQVETVAPTETTPVEVMPAGSEENRSHRGLANIVETWRHMDKNEMAIEIVCHLGADIVLGFMIAYLKLFFKLVKDTCHEERRDKCKCKTKKVCPCCDCSIAKLLDINVQPMRI